MIFIQRKVSSAINNDKLYFSVSQTQRLSQKLRIITAGTQAKNLCLIYKKIGKNTPKQ